MLPGEAMDDVGDMSSSPEASQSPAVDPDTALPAASSSKEGPGKARKLKHRRTQNSACDSCRHRRVRCIREPHAVDCTPCLVKGVRCTTDYIANKPKIRRSGKLIREAQAMYGGREAMDPGSASAPSVSPSVPPSDTTANGRELPLHSPDLQTAHTLLAINPQEMQLAQRTLSTMLISRLVNLYYSYIHFQLPILDIDNFKGRFEAAGGRPDAMGPYGEVLAMAVCAFGAHVADSPEILGPGAPTLDDLRANAVDAADLSVWGERRKPFCRMLLDRTLTLIDTRGVMRKPTMDGICSLLICQYLIDHAGLPGDQYQSRMLSAAALEQMRALNDAPMGTAASIMGQIRGGRLFWCSFIRDAMAAAHSGRALQLTQLDINLFAPMLLNANRSEDSVIEALSSDDPAAVARSAAFSLFGELAMLARSMSEKITGPGATLPSRAPTSLDLDWVDNTFWQGVDQSSRLCEYFRSRVRKVFTVRAGTFELWLRTLCFCRLALVALMHGVLTEQAGRADLGEGGNPQILARLRSMLVTSQRRLFTALLEMVDIVRVSALSGVSFGGGLLLSGLPHFAELMVSLPSAEDGGPPEWTLADKVESIQWMHLAMKRMSWAWGDEGGCIKNVEASLAPLRDRLAAMQSAAATSSQLPPSIVLPMAPFDEGFFGVGGAPMPVFPHSFSVNHDPPFFAGNRGWQSDLDNLLDPRLL